MPQPSGPPARRTSRQVRVISRGVRLARQLSLPPPNPPTLPDLTEAPPQIMGGWAELKTPESPSQSPSDALAPPSAGSGPTTGDSR